MKLIKPLIAVASLVAVALTMTVPANTTSAWTDQTALTATTRMAAIDVDRTGGPPYPGEGTVITDPKWTFPDAPNGQGNICVEFNAEADEAWSVYFRLDEAPLWGSENIWAEGWVEEGEGVTEAGAETITFTGHAGAVEGQKICLSSHVNPLVDASRFDATLDPGWQREATERFGVCTTLTVMPKASQPTPFYFGWEATLDLTAGFAMFPDGDTPDTFYIEGDWQQHTNDGTWQGGTVHVRSTTLGALREGSADFSFDVCVRNW